MGRFVHVLLVTSCILFIGIVSRNLAEAGVEGLGFAVSIQQAVKTFNLTPAPRK